MLVILFLVSFAFQALVISVVTVNANHDTCSDTSPQIFLKCKESRKQTANESCFTNNAGDSTAIESCVGEVNAHFAHTGPGSAPALPDGAASGSTADKAAKKVVEKADCNKPDLDSENCKIIKYVNLFINTLSVLVGIVVTIMIIVGGIQYSAAGEDPGAVAKAKKRISQAVLALVGYGLTYAFLQYIIPGGPL